MLLSNKLNAGMIKYNQEKESKLDGYNSIENGISKEVSQI